jgi:hypothetical protein
VPSAREWNASLRLNGAAARCRKAYDRLRQRRKHLPSLFCLPAEVDNVSGAYPKTGPENTLFFRKLPSALAKPPEMQYNSETQKNRCKCVSPERSCKEWFMFSITPS